MADVDYMKYAAYMGARNPIATGLNDLGDTIDQDRRVRIAEQEGQRRNSLADLQIQNAQATAADTAAHQGALKSVYGAPDMQTAYSMQMQAEQQQKAMEAEQKGFTNYLNTVTALDNVKGIDADTKTLIAKEFLRQNPKYAPIADVLTYVDSKGIKAARMYKDGELKDPVNGQPLPAGYYETEGTWTGDITNPVKLTSYKLGADPTAKKAEYKTRSYDKGNQHITEESQDGGMTWKPVATAPRYKPQSGGAGRPERDLPSGIQDKISTKLEIYNDWSTLKNNFKPEFMPSTPVKSINEMQINLNKIFGKNQAAVDWWTQYFDARNIILKERSGAAVMEPEFRRFEQGTIAANTNPTTVINYLDRSEKKYKQHVDSYLEANRKNHPESVKAFENAFGYQGKSSPATTGKAPKTASDYLNKFK